MNEQILFSLEHCQKCEQTKELLQHRDDIKYITLSHDVSQWNEQEKELVNHYNVLQDLERTAPILWVNGEKKIGFLQIKKWLQDH